jgi:hypothetical protein
MTCSEPDRSGTHQPNYARDRKRLIVSALLIVFGWAILDVGSVVLSQQPSSVLRIALPIAGCAMIASGIYLWATSGKRRGK